MREHYAMSLLTELSSRGQQDNNILRGLWKKHEL